MIGILFRTAEFTKELLFYTYLGLQLGLLWDLKRSIQKPFESNGYRHKIIIFSCPVFFFVLFLTNLLKLFTRESIGDYNFGIIGPFEEVLYSGFRYDLYVVPFDAVLILLLMIGSFSISYFAIKGLTRKGIN